MTVIDHEDQLRTLFAGCRIGGRDFLPLYFKAMKTTSTPVGDWKIYRRALRAFILAQYFQRSLTVEGAFAECGVFQGFSAYMLRTLMESTEAAPKAFHLIDSFEGLSQPGTGDRLVIDGTLQENTIPPGHFKVDLEQVYARFSGLENVYWHKGWIPEVLAELPEQAWAFVHIDVDLYEPTKTALEYFLPRMSPGGIIVNDDYGSPDFPGAGRAWHETLEPLGVPYIVLDGGQAIYIRDRS